MIVVDKKYEQIVESLLGRTVIVDNMDTAIALAKQNSYSFKIVTLKGDVINPSGAIQGGSVQTKTVNILGRSKEIEELQKNIKDLNSKINEINTKKDNYEKSVSDVIEMSKILDNDIKEIDITYATEKQKVVAIEERIASLESRLNKLKQEAEKNENQKTEYIKQKETEKLKIQEIESEIQNLNN